MSALQALFLLPAALILDLLFSEPPARVHPVCGMGYLASRAEPFFRRLLSCPFPVKQRISCVSSSAIVLACCPHDASYA